MRQRYSQNYLSNDREYRKTNNYISYYNKIDNREKRKYNSDIYSNNDSSDESINEIINKDSRKRKVSAASFNDFNDDYLNNCKELSLNESNNDNNNNNNRKNKGYSSIFF